MTVILCAGPRGEVLFHHRRVSRDSAVVRELLSIAAERGLWITPYSAKLLPQAVGLIVSEEPFAEAGENDVCFVEDTFEAIYQHIQEIDELIVYRWDKTYPLDQTFNITDFLEKAETDGCSFIQTENFEFQGRVHEQITREVYQKCES